MSYFVQTINSTAGVKAENAGDALKFIKWHIKEYMQYDGCSMQDPYVQEILLKIENSTVLGQALMILEDISGKLNKQGNYTNLAYNGNVCSYNFESLTHMLERYGHGKLTVIGEDGEKHIYDYNH